MMPRSCVCGWTAVVCLAAIGAFAQETPPEEMARWIRQLGAPTHAEREEASAALWRIGEAALDPVREAAHSPDPEVAVRARALLADMARGIRSSWPEALRQNVRAYDTLSAPQREAVLQELTAVCRDEAAPFLLSRVRRGEAADAGAAADRLIGLLEADPLRQWILDRIQNPANEHEARVLATACEKSGGAAELARGLGAPHLPTSLRDRMVQTALRRLHGRMDAREHEPLHQEAALLAQALPNEARFLYFQAAAAAHLKYEAQAAELCRRALALNPDQEAPHFLAGALLGALGQPRLALLEWNRILEIPPADEIYDINAQMRIGAIHAARKEFTPAAEAYEKGLKMFRAAKAEAGNSMGMIGGSEEELEKRIAHLREMAAQSAEQQDALTFRLETIVKDDRAKALNDMRAGADAIMSMRVQPHGIRLFEVAPATVQYDAEHKEFVVLLNGERAGPGVSGALKEGKTRVAVGTLDMQYLFEIDSETGASEKRDTFELDYVLRIEPAPSIQAWKTPGLDLNGAPHTWAELREGVPFDFLPEKIELEVRGMTPEGEERKLQFTLDPARLHPGPDAISQ
jgi:tetratricopeptide (TPR) repeat protein